MEIDLDTLRARLDALKPRWPEVAKAGDVPIGTLERVARGYTKNPRVGTFQALLRGVESVERN